MTLALNNCTSGISIALFLYVVYITLVYLGVGLIFWFGCCKCSVFSVCPFSRGPKESDEFMADRDFKYTGTYRWTESKETKAGL